VFENKTVLQYAMLWDLTS